MGYVTQKSAALFRSRRDAAQQAVQHCREEHRRTQQRQHTEPHHILRQEEQRDRRDHRTSPEYDSSPLKGVTPHRQAEARQQEEHPADALLPQKARAPDVPLLRDAKEKDHIPHPVIEHHADEVKPPQLVQQTIAERLLLFHIFYPSLFPKSR